ncbi:MAG: hypothetical protein K8R67_07155 [Desulfobacteraceae bacterium]|nr:hypothetical protein [Desulfobacteraceae bacterium]
MKLVFFIHKDSSKKGEILQKIINTNFYGTKCQIFRAFDTLKKSLKREIQLTENEIFILLAESVSRLNELNSFIDLLEGKRIILILPDSSKASLSKASKFFPRFFTSISDTYDDLCDVLNKIINQERIKLN